MSFELLIVVREEDAIGNCRGRGPALLPSIMLTRVDVDYRADSFTMDSDDDEGMDTQGASSSTQKSLAGIKLYILPAKIDPELMGSLVDDAEGAAMTLVGRPDDAEIIVTEIRMRKRLERHMDWEVSVRSCRRKVDINCKFTFYRKRNRW